MSNYTCLAGYQKRRKVFGDDAASGGSFLSSMASGIKSLFKPSAQGASAGNYTDPLTVAAVQRAILKMPAYSTDAALDLGHSGADGKLGDNTKRAVAQVNMTYRNAMADEDRITDGTLAYFGITKPSGSPSPTPGGGALTTTPSGGHGGQPPPEAGGLIAGLEPWQLGVAAGLGGLGLILLVVAIAKR